MALHDDILLRQLTAFVEELAARVAGDRDLEGDTIRQEIAGRVGLDPAVAVKLGAAPTLSFLTTPDGLDHGRAVLLGLGVAVEADVVEGPPAADLRQVAAELLAAGLPGLPEAQRRAAGALARDLGVPLPP